MSDYKVVSLGCDPWSEELKQEVTASPHYKTVKLWLADKSVAIEETPYYKWLYDQLITEGSVWNGILNSVEDITKRCQFFKQLLDLAPNFPDQPITSKVVDGITYYYGPICIKIANDGGMRIWDGMHRIAILLAMGYPIKLTVCERGKSWQKLVDDLKALYPTLMYQAIPHPEFADWTCCDNSNKESLLVGVVKEHKIGSILDLGSCHGHVLYVLKDIVKSASGVEYNQVRYAAMKVLFDKIGFKSHHGNFFDVIGKLDTTFDCVFALAVFHHFSRENPIERFNELLDRIRRLSDMLLYELPEPGEEQYSWMYDTDMHKLVQSRYNTVVATIQMHKRKLVLLQG